MSAPHSRVDADAWLVQAAQVGGLAAFEALVDRHERQVCSNAFRILRQPEDAEDVGRIRSDCLTTLSPNCGIVTFAIFAMVLLLLY